MAVKSNIVFFPCAIVWVILALLVPGARVGVGAAAMDTDTDQEPQSAWDVLVRRDPEAAGELRLAERHILERLSPEQGEALGRGADPETIILADGTVLAELIAKFGAFSIPFWSIDGGGGVSVGGSFALRGAIGQPDVGQLAGGCFALHGGFLPAGELNSGVFSDGFELGSVGCWTDAIGLP